MNENNGAADMRVAVRLRPLSQQEIRRGIRPCVQTSGDRAVVIEKFGNSHTTLRSQQKSSNEYAFDLVFSENASQEEVYCKTVKDLIPTILNGYDATVFAYGATGAGKTHTMMGTERTGQDPVSGSADHVDGIIPHALTDTFRLIDQRKIEERRLAVATGCGFSWKVLLTYLEVYNEQLRDLLQPSSSNLVLREDPSRGNVIVAGLHHEVVTSAEQVLQLLRRGNRNRKTESTGANAVSSRSHAVLQVIVQRVTTSTASSAPTTSTSEGKLSLIDLAGSERASATMNKGVRLVEGANINKSLLALANCINALATQSKANGNNQPPTLDASGKPVMSLAQQVKKPSRFGFRRKEKPASKPKAPMPPTAPIRVQYRDSKLTHLLKNSFEGSCRLVMIAGINPSHTCYDESHNTLKYANRAKNIKVAPKQRVVTNGMALKDRLMELEKENRILREKLNAATHSIPSLREGARGSSNSLPQASSPYNRQLRTPTSFSTGNEIRRSSTYSPSSQSRIPSTSRRKSSTGSGYSETIVDARRSMLAELTLQFQPRIAHLEEQKVKLEEQVVNLIHENHSLHSRMKSADTLLKVIKSRQKEKKSRMKGIAIDDSDDESLDLSMFDDEEEDPISELSSVSSETSSPISHTSVQVRPVGTDLRTSEQLGEEHMRRLSQMSQKRSGIPTLSSTINPISVLGADHNDHLPSQRQGSGIIPAPKSYTKAFQELQQRKQLLTPRSRQEFNSNLPQLDREAAEADVDALIEVLAEDSSFVNVHSKHTSRFSNVSHSPESNMDQHENVDLKRHSLHTNMQNTKDDNAIPAKKWGTPRYVAPQHHTSPGIKLMPSALKQPTSIISPSIKKKVVLYENPVGDSSSPSRIANNC